MLTNIGLHSSVVHWCSIDNFSLTMDDFDKCVRFVSYSYNYKVTFNEKVYLQTSGVPIETHFAPTFAVISMNLIENGTLDVLRNKKIEPILFKR